jgi:hypothetical protein
MMMTITINPLNLTDAPVVEQKKFISIRSPMVADRQKKKIRKVFTKVTTFAGMVKSQILLLLENRNVLERGLGIEIKEKR